jgi:hypothetical protein
MVARLIEKLMARVVYKPVGVGLGVVSGLVAGSVFKQVWRLVAHEQEAPTATERQRGWFEVVAAATLQGAVFGGVKALVDRAGATGFERVTGVWPGASERIDKP